MRHSFLQGNVVLLVMISCPHWDYLYDCLSLNERYGKADPGGFGPSHPTPLIPGLDGRKMSKSYGNAISLSMIAEETAKLTKKLKTDSSAWLALTQTTVLAFLRFSPLLAFVLAVIQRDCRRDWHGRRQSTGGWQHLCWLTLTLSRFVRGVQSFAAQPDDSWYPSRRKRLSCNKDC